MIPSTARMHSLLNSSDETRSPLLIPPTSFEAQSEPAAIQIKSLTSEGLPLLYESWAEGKLPVHSGGTVVADLHEIHAAICRNALQLVRENGEAMALVLRPDQSTELFLKLKNIDGMVTVHVRMEHGDFNKLNVHWPQLQEGLTILGVRLAKLEMVGRPATHSEPHPLAEQPARAA